MTDKLDAKTVKGIAERYLDGAKATEREMMFVARFALDALAVIDAVIKHRAARGNDVAEASYAIEQALTAFQEKWP